MAEHMLNDARIVIGSYVLSSNMNAVTIAFSAEALDNTVFGDTTRSNMGGLKDVEFSGSVLKSYGTNENDDLFHGWVGTANVPITASAEGGDEGERAFSFRAVHLSAPGLSGTVGDLHVVDVSAKGSDGWGLVAGNLLEDGKTSRLASANGAAQELTAISAGQYGYGTLHVTAWNATSLDVKIQSDTVGFPSATDQITFTQATALTHEMKRVAGPITDTYWRVIWTLVGTSASFVVNFGIK